MQCPQGQTVPLSRSATSDGQSDGERPIEGDEWDAYVTLDTFSTNGTRDGLTGASPMATESP